jgi:hypothetical protein
MATFHIEVLRDIIDESLKKGFFINPAFELAQEEFAEVRDTLIEDFDNHAVTKEIEAGIDSENGSGTLSQIGGGNHKEEDHRLPNLFSFIGFLAGSEPIEPLRRVIFDNTYIKMSGRGARYERQKDRIQYFFPVYWPAKHEIEVATKMPPLTPGNSWAYDLEKPGGISGINEYIYWREFYAKSKSEGGIQAKRSLRSVVFQPVDYLKEIFGKFKAKLKF